MFDRPIIFSAPMVRALIEGRKTQTRRVLRPQPVEPVLDRALISYNRGVAEYSLEPNCLRPNNDLQRWKLPETGDLLWVREAWCMASRSVEKSKIYYKAHEDAVHTKFHRYVNTSAVGNVLPTYPRFKPSIYMPRWASRLTLLITDMRVQRIQDISEDDAILEGITRGDPLPELPDSKGVIWHSGIETDLDNEFTWSRQPRQAFCNLWNSINGIGSWQANPWVAAYTFIVLQQNIDEAKNANK